MFVIGSPNTPSMTQRVNRLLSPTGSSQVVEKLKNNSLVPRASSRRVKRFCRHSPCAAIKQLGQPNLKTSVAMLNVLLNTSSSTVCIPNVKRFIRLTIFWQLTLDLMPTIDQHFVLIRASLIGPPTSRPFTFRQLSYIVESKPHLARAPSTVAIAFVSRFLIRNVMSPPSTSRTP